MDTITLTGNLLLEWTLEFDELNWSKTQRATTDAFQVGGKGINVSKMLNRFDHPNQAYTFSEGALEALASEWLETNGFRFKTFHLGQSPRIGLVARTEGMKETTFLGKDRSVPEASWLAACKEIATARPTYCALCGSVPGWEASFKEGVDLILKSGESKLFIDTYGKPLEDLYDLPADCIKINRDEFNSLKEGHADLSPPEVCQWIDDHSACRNWILTDGAQEALIKSEAGNYLFQPVTVEEASPVGCGDVTFAALIQARSENKDWLEAIQFAFAHGSANASRDGIADFELPIEDRYLSNRLESIKR